MLFSNTISKKAIIYHLRAKLHVLNELRYTTDHAEKWHDSAHVQNSRITATVTYGQKIFTFTVSDTDLHLNV